MDNRNPRNPNILTIWQWNCRGYRQKHGTLRQYICDTDTPPDVIAIQETGIMPTQTGYTTYTTSPESKSATLVLKTLTVVQHAVDGSDTDHNLVEILPIKRGQLSTFILNIYSPPSRKKEKLDYVIAQAISIAKQNDLVIVGDFNAAHPAWGYAKSTTKGSKLWESIQRHRLTILTDPMYPTRIGNSVQRDTCPDLTMTRGIAQAEWLNTDETLGSDHCVLITTIPMTRKNKIIKKTRITDWATFRKQRRAEPETKIESLEDWVRRLQEDLEANSKAITLTTETPAVDPHLLHLWEARRGLLKRWRRQKHNRTLKLRIAKVTEEAAKYANELTSQNWLQVCNNLQGTLGTAKTWSFLRHLLDPTQSKTASQQTMHRIIHQHPGTDDDILEALKTKYIGQARQGTPHHEYNGAENSELDKPIEVAEVKQALQSCTRNTTPGGDKVSNRLLRNLDEDSIQALTDYFNNHWESGTLPKEWKHADIVLIPKPGKKQQLDNLRPISLTSCIGKLLEHVILNRLQPYLEDNELFPHTMFGFRPLLSTQDILLQLKEDVITQASLHSVKAILALDLKGAFDNVGHHTILENLGTTNCGQRTYNYIRSFLTDRTATVGIGPLRTPTTPTPNKGTPQGAVLSPTLFNIAMMRLPEKLNEIEGLHHSLYADDITLWTTNGSEGQIQDTLQRATDAVQQYARASGLQCSPEKSELLVVRRIRKGTPYDESPIQLTLEDHEIPRVERIRILGLHIEQDGGGAYMIQRLTQTSTQIMGMIRRIASRNHGMKEADATRLVQALIISRIVYSTPYLKFKVTEIEKLETLLRKAYKQALGLPPNTATAKLLALGVHNTVAEHIEAHLISQRERLTQTAPGRQVLRRLNYPVSTSGHKRTVKIPSELRDKINVAPIPRNMHPDHHPERRQARANTLQERFGKHPDSRFTDAAKYTGRPAMSISVINHELREVVSATVQSASPTEAEEAAIALAMVSEPNKERMLILTDSQAACRNYGKGRISATAYRILSRRYLDQFPDVSILWTPGHENLCGNQQAHAVARAHTSRVPQEEDLLLEPIPLNYNTILQHQRLGRRSLPPPHKTLTKEETVGWRLLQTNTFPHLGILHAVYPTIYPSNKCPLCNNKYASLYHITWACPNIEAAPKISNPTVEQWEAALSSSNPTDQRQLVARARSAALATGALD